MNIGVWLGDNFIPQTGGGYSYVAQLIRAIDQHQFSSNVTVKFLSRYDGWSLNHEVVVLSSLPVFLRRWMQEKLRPSNLLVRVIWRLERLFGVIKILNKHKIKLIYYIRQGECILPNFPFVSTNWDIGHCSTYAFPELIYNDNFRGRTHLYSSILPKALMVFCESETGKQELLRYTTVGEHKIRIVPMFAGNVSSLNLSKERSTSIVNKLQLEIGKYFFYPAQFWAHKNHYNLLKAFARFHQRYSDYKLVLCGSDKGNLNYVKELVNRYNLKNAVVLLGFVPEETLYSLYKHCASFVMASHFGPTNMPPIEAMEIGCPVICSDIGGHHEIMGNAAVYFNSFSPDSILNAMETIIEKREEFFQKVMLQREKTHFNVSNAISALDKALSEAAEIRSNWD